MKKVIFIGGTAYSGSTFFDMTIANDPHGFSCGEVNAIFYPSRPYHLELERLSQNTDWQSIKKSGLENLYPTIFEKYPNVNYIVDSSKSPLWIADRTQDCHKAGIDVKNILIWKTPDSFRRSRLKRNIENGWTKAWLRYHKYYMSMVHDWRAVKYSDVTKGDPTLEALCHILDIPYFEGKGNFWEKEHNTLFGNASAKIHLYSENSKEHERYKDELNKTINDTNAADPGEKDSQYKTLIVDNSVEEQDPYADDRRFSDILKVLHYADIFNDNFDLKQLELMQASIRSNQFYKMAQQLKQKVIGPMIRSHI